MLEALIQFLLKYKFVIIFYALVILFLLLKRKSIEIQAKFIFLYRTTWGLSLIEYFSQKWREWVILLGYIGVGAGYVGLVIISFVLVKNLISLILNPATPSGVALVLPGISVPGMGVLPFWYWLLAIFLIAVVHEFSHGIVARAHKIEVKNTGLVFFGPILGAFVEPNEKKLRAEKDIIQYSVLAAGSFSNVLLAILALVLLSGVFAPLQEKMVSPIGFSFASYAGEKLPFELAGIAPGTIITGFNDLQIFTFENFAEELAFHRPGEKIKVQTTEKSYEVTLAPHPENAKKAYLGIKEIKNENQVFISYQSGPGKILYSIIVWLAGFLRWLFLLSLGIGLFNLLPLPLVDGGRMAQVFLHKLHGPEKGEKRYKQVGLFFLLILLLNLFWPLLQKLF